MKKLFLFLGLLIGAVCNGKVQSDEPFARFPTINPDGSKVVISYEGDIWTVPIEGGNARRMTVNRTPAQMEESLTTQKQQTA